MEVFPCGSRLGYPLGVTCLYRNWSRVSNQVRDRRGFDRATPRAAYGSAARPARRAARTGANNNALSHRDVTELTPSDNTWRCQGPLRDNTTVADFARPRSGRGVASIAVVSNKFPKESFTITVAGCSVAVNT